MTRDKAPGDLGRGREEDLTSKLAEDGSLIRPGTPEDEKNRFRGTHVTVDDRGESVVSHRHKLVVVQGTDRGTEVNIEGMRVVIGTHESCDLVLTDPTVSRRHCEIVVQDDRYLLRDLGSTNGSSLGGTPVIEAYLTPGARIGLGHTIVVFQPKKKWVRVAASDSEWFGDLFGRSQPMREVFGLFERVAPTDLSLVLIGETGTGKELAARALHSKSHRAERPFVVVDCGAVSQTLVESELFGHERGAYTGADRSRAGAFELADGGTIFLDEVGELPPALQPKLLRALEQREVKRLGAAKPLTVDVRVIAATNRDLRAQVVAGKFREDLYYRLAEVVAVMPPLRERREDIQPLAQLFLEEQSRRGGVARFLSPDLISVLETRPWPGNVRELRNVLRRACVLSRGETLGPEDLPEGGLVRPRTEPLDLSDVDNLPIKDAREKWTEPMEREYLVRLIRKTQGDLDKAADIAGVHRKSVERLLRKHGLRVNQVIK
jgi:DNA-binding NtrC family response regulator